MADARRAARRLSEDEILQNSTITDDDLARARAWWRSHAPSALRELIDARVVEKAKSGD